MIELSILFPFIIIVGSSFILIAYLGLSSIMIKVTGILIGQDLSINSVFGNGHSNKWRSLPMQVSVVSDRISNHRDTIVRVLMPLSQKINTPLASLLPNTLSYQTHALSLISINDDYFHDTPASRNISIDTPDPLYRTRYP